MSSRPIAVIIAATRAQIRCFGPAVEQAGYTISFLASADTVSTSHVTRQAVLLVYNQAVGHTAILSGYRTLPQRPDLVMLHDDQALPGEGFPPEQRVLHTPDALELLLRRHLTTDPSPDELPVLVQPDIPVSEQPVTAPPSTEQQEAIAPSETVAEEQHGAGPPPVLVVVAAEEEHETDTLPHLHLATLPVEEQQEATVVPEAAPVSGDEQQEAGTPPPHPHASPPPAEGPRERAAPPVASEPKPATRVVEPSSASATTSEHKKLRTVETPPPRSDKARRYGKGMGLLVGLLFVLLLATIVSVVLNQFSDETVANGSETSITSVEVTASNAGASATESVLSTPTQRTGDADATSVSRSDSPTPAETPTPRPTTEGATTALTPTRLDDIDLVAEVIDVVPSQPVANDVVNVRVRIHNDSTRAITETFWVDLYIAPQGEPVVNQLWTDLSPYGATWLVEGLEANETRVLESLGADPSRSNLLYFPDQDAVEVYALVDSYGFDEKGAITERDEGNNLSPPFEIPVSTGNAGE